MMSATAAADPAAQGTPSRSLTASALRRFTRRPLAITALTLLVTILISGAFSHTIAPHNFIVLSSAVAHQPPSLDHPFGTDALGRDMLVRTLYGVQTTEEIALTAALLASILGVFAGVLAGYYGGWLDAVLMRLADLVTAYPAVILTLAAIVYLGEAYPHNLVVIFASFMWAVVARVVRAHTATLHATEFVEAARALGASDLRIMFRHLLPNIGGTVLIAATSLLGQIILIDATVEFFGYGLPSAISPSLGNLVADVVQNKFGLVPVWAVLPGLGWWTWVFPCAVLVLILVCVNLIGDALDTALNPAAI